MSNWLENEALKEDALLRLGGLRWTELKAAIQRLTDHFSELYTKEQEGEACSFTDNGKSVTLVIQIPGEERRRTIDFDDTHWSVSVDKSIPRITIRGVAKNDAAFFSSDGKISLDDTTEVLLKDFFFHGKLKPLADSSSLSRGNRPNSPTGTSDERMK